MGWTRTNTTGPGSRYVRKECTAAKTGKHRDAETRMKCPKCGGTNVDKADAFVSKAPTLGGGAQRVVTTNGANAHIETRDAKGRLHSFNDEPALIVLRPDGSRKRAEWRKDGKKHRDHDLPATEAYDGDGDFAQKLGYYENGVKGRSSDMVGEERVTKGKNGEPILVERQWQNPEGKLVRTESWRTGGRYVAMYEQDGSRRADGPSGIHFDDNGKVTSESFTYAYGSYSTPVANAYAHFLVDRGLVHEDASPEFIEHLCDSVHPGFVGEEGFKEPDETQWLIAKTIFGDLER